MTKIKVDNTAELIRLYAEGVISPAEWEQLVAEAPPDELPDDITHLTLADYADAIGGDGDDYHVCRTIWVALGGKWEPIPPPFDFLRRLHAVGDGLKKINDLFEALPSPPLSAMEQQAGFGNLNFGVGGLIDRLARRQGITDEQAKGMTINAVLGKLAIDGRVAICEKKYQKLINAKTR